MINFFLLTVFVVSIVLIVIWIAWGNTALEIKTIRIASQSLPTGFRKCRIAQISDLHNAEFGKSNRNLISMLKKTEADVIVITGDVVDSRRTDIEKAIFFAERAAEMAPTYYVNGNHESRLNDTAYKHLITGLEKAGVIVLENKATDLPVGEESITLIGINDPNFRTESAEDTAEHIVAQQLRDSVPQNDHYKVLLAHKPEYLNVYADQVDLVFAGHAHGGQFILPFAGGLIAPGQGIFPPYYDGLYESGTTKMIVSRGIGNSLFPFRINNRPVIVVAELTTLREE